MSVFIDGTVTPSFLCAERDASAPGAPCEGTFQSTLYVVSCHTLAGVHTGVPLRAGIRIESSDNGCEQSYTWRGGLPRVTGKTWLLRDWSPGRRPHNPETHEHLDRHTSQVLAGTHTVRILSVLPPASICTGKSTHQRMSAWAAPAKICIDEACAAQRNRLRVHTLYHM